MIAGKTHHKFRHLWHWIVGFSALLWILLRSGTNPKRLTYPCQRAAMPIAANWILALAAFFGGSLLLKRFTKISIVVISIAGAIWFIGALPNMAKSDVRTDIVLPVWEVPDPISTVFVMDSIPATSGSLAPGDETVPDAYLTDPAIDTLLAMLAEKGTFIHKTATHPEGLIGSDNIVIIKGNYQWNSYNTTSTDRVKGLIWKILQHPDGFSGEIIVCDNTQDIGTGFNHSDNNSEDPAQSLIDVVFTFSAKGYPVYYLDWNYIWAVEADEYSSSDYSNGYIYESDTKISYPKFRTPSFNHYVSLKYGVWDSLSAEYDSARLAIIDFPVLKAHSWGGSTIAVKNWVGVLTTAHATIRYGSWNQMHDVYFFGPHALVARTLAVTYPRLTIVDATWTTKEGPVNLSQIENTKILAASTDPLAVSWYTAKYVLTPIANYPNQTDPDNPGGTYNTVMGYQADFLADSTELPSTMDSSRISVYDRWVFPDVSEPDVVVSSPQSGEVYDSLPELTIELNDDRNLDRGYYQINACQDDWTELWSYNSLSADTVITWQVPDLPAGTHTIYFKVMDDASNINSDSCDYFWEFTYSPYICGDANGDETVNVSDAVKIINYIFVGGDPPDPMEAGDCNCDLTVNVSDAVWIINYVFVGGNDPCDTDGDGGPDC